MGKNKVVDIKFHNQPNLTTKMIQRTTNIKNKMIKIRVDTKTTEPVSICSSSSP